MRCLFHGWITALYKAQVRRTTFLAALATVFLAHASVSVAQQKIETQVNVTTLQRAGFAGDSDDDGIPDVIDVDDDNDTIPDDVEGTADADGDGVPDCLDLDSDNDGISDLLEAVSGSGLMILVDADRDGKLDDNVSVGENGLADVVETADESGMSLTGTRDLDGDGIRDHQDLDVDNDGIPDVVEAGSSDQMFDGRYDFFLDLDGDGLADRLLTSPIVAIDSDQDGIEDFRDADSDQDGLSDRFESGGDDADGDGRVDNFVDINMDGLDDSYALQARALPDTDQDGFPDYRDIDSDGDGVTDAEEAFGMPASSTPIEPSVPFNSRPTSQNDEITLQTGESGSVFGCTLNYESNTRQPVDPVLLLMIAVSMMIVLRRRATSICTQLKSFRTRSAGVIAASALLLGACTTSPGVAPIDNANFIHGYAGIGLGASFLNANTTDIPLEQDESFSAAGQLTLGLSLSSRFALEARGADLGQATFISGEAVGYQVADVSGLYKQSFSPSSSKWTGFGRLGVGALFNDGDIDTTQKNKTHVLVGFGAEYALSPRSALRAEWQGHDVDVMHTQFSFLFRFGAPSTHRAPVIAENTTTEGEERLSDSSFQAVPKKTLKPPEPITVEPPEPELVVRTLPRPAPNPKPRPRPVPTPAAVEPPSAPLPELLIAEPEVFATAEEVPDEAPARPQTTQANPPTSDEQLALVTPEDVTPPESGSESPNSLISAPVERNNLPSNADIDKDGIVDASDNCLGTKAGEPVLANGCSLFADPVPGLKFLPDTDRLTTEAKGVLDTVANVLTDESDIRITVAAHTRASTDPNAAMFLTRRRTIAIIRYLSDKGIDATRLRPEAYGDTQPLASAAKPSDNDRVVLSRR